MISTVPALGDGECQVWWATPRPMADTVLDPLLAPVERARRERYRHDGERDRFTTGVVLSRVVLGAHLGVAPERLEIDRTCERCAEPHGKPRVEGPFEYSISHSGDRVALAVTRGAAVGVDVEQVGRLRDLDAMIDHVLSPGEKAALDGVADRDAGFITYWARKEAVVKATGDGIGAGLRTVVVTPPDQPPRVVSWPARPDLAIRVHDLDPGPAHRASVAVLTSAEVAITEHSAEL